MRKLLLAVAIGLAAACGGSDTPNPGPGSAGEIEPNDSIAQATPTTSNGTIGGEISTSTDNDYFSFTLASSQFVRIHTFDATGMGCTDVDPALQVFNSGGALVASESNNGLGDASGTSYCEDLEQTFAAGTYYVRVSAGTLGVTLAPFSYTLEISTPTQPATTAESESNGTIATANGPFTTDALLTAAINPIGDDDFFGVANPGASPALVHLDTWIGGFGSCTSGDTVLYVVDGSGTQVAYDDDGGLNLCSRMDIVVPPGQTRYVRIIEFGENATISSYMLWIDFM